MISFILKLLNFIDPEGCSQSSCGSEDGLVFQSVSRTTLAYQLLLLSQTNLTKHNLGLDCWPTEESYFFLFMSRGSGDQKVPVRNWGGWTYLHNQSVNLLLLRALYLRKRRTGTLNTSLF